MANLDTDSPCVSILSTREIVGLSFIAESGVISTVAVLIFASLVLRNIIDNHRNPGPNGPAPLIRTHVDGYMISLMFADLLQGIGAFTSAKWAAKGRVECSSYCTAQGVIQQLGETGVAMSSLAIAIHTFATVFFRWQPSRRPWLWSVVVALIWTFLLLFVVLGYVTHRGQERKVGGKPYFGPTPFWCWIGASYLWERIVGEYFWLWCCAILNIILYTFLFFTLRGNIDVDPGNWRRIRFHRRSRDGIFGGIPSAANPMAHAMSMKDAESMRLNKVRNKEAMKMFWYPLSYTFLVLPLTINRWSTFGLSSSTSEPVKDMSIIPSSVVVFIFGLSGLINVLLFLLTRPNLLLFNVRREKKRLRQNSQMGAESGMLFNHNFSDPANQQLGVDAGDLTHRRQYNDGEDDEYLDDRRSGGGDSMYFGPFYPPAPHKLAPIPPLLSSPEGEGVVTFPYPSEKAYGVPLHTPLAQYAPSPDEEEGVDVMEEDSRRSSSSKDKSIVTEGAVVAPAVDRTEASPSFSSAAFQSANSNLHHRQLSTSTRSYVELADNLLPRLRQHVPIPPEPVYSRSAPPIAPPPVGYPSSDTTRSRVEEWALLAEQERMTVRRRGGGSPTTPP